LIWRKAAGAANRDHATPYREKTTMRIPHELRDEFPDAIARIEQLKKSDHDFGVAVTRYDEVNAAIHRIEAGWEPTADEVLENLKKERLSLKDRINAILHTRASPAAKTS
jgi:uncharacterized protein YdcH (DUF465 family)